MVKRLLCKSEDLSLDARDPLKKLGAMPSSAILALGREAETRESLQLSSLLVLLNCWVSGSGRDPDSKLERERGRHSTPSARLYRCTHRHASHIHFF